jgi:hypothetical protein
MMECVQAEHGTYLVADEELNKGGVGSIHLTDDPRWVFKRYLRPDKAPDREHLGQLVGIGREVLMKPGAVPGQSPESSVNWPVDMALDRRGSVAGVVLPAIPATLFNEYGKPRGLEFLVMARAHPPAAMGRVALLVRMAEILTFVNARGLVHGDVNGKNLVWAVSPNPVMYLIDCDGMVPQDPPPTVGVQAMGWIDPRVLDRIAPAHDHYSDWYALALAMYRGLLLTPGKLDSKTADGKWPEPSKIPGSLNPQIADLLRRALNKPLVAQGRPRPDEWVKALLDVYLPNGRFDGLTLAALDKISKPPASPMPPTFTAFPDTDWTTTHPQQRRPPPGVARSRVPVPPPPPVGPVHPPRPPARQTYPPPVPQSPVVHDRPLGRLARRSLNRGFRWHLRGVLSCLLIPYIAIIYIGISWLQLRKADEYQPGLRSAKIALRIYGAAAAVIFIILLAQSLSNTS